MAIVLYVSDGYGGYGDLLFGLKVINGLKRALTKIGYDEPLYLVTQESGKKKILQLEGDSEFGVEVKSIEEFNISKGAQRLDYFIEGPVFRVSPI